MLTLRFEERRTQKLFLNTECVTQRKMDTAVHGRRLGGAVPGAPPIEWGRKNEDGSQEGIVRVEMPDHGELQQNGLSRGRGVHSASRPLSESADMSRSAEERIYDLFVNQRYAECHSIDTMSDGSISPDYLASWVPCESAMGGRTETGLRK